MIKKYLFIFLLLCISLLNGQHQDPSSLFITSEGHLTQPVIELLKLDSLYHPGETLPEAVQLTQKKWVKVIQGNNDKERTDLVDTEQDKSQVEQVEKIVRSMHLLDARPPTLHHYNYGICLGDFLNGIRMRLHQLVKDWQQGIRFDSLIFLTGERYLRKGTGQEDEITKLIDPKQSPLPFKKEWKLPVDYRYETEYDLCKLIWEQTALPTEMEEALKGKVIFVDASRGLHTRPSTKDTYLTWLKEYHPAPGSILAPSHPLLWVLQDLAARSVLGSGYYIDTTAPGLSPQMMSQYRHAFVSLVHDTVAKCLYEIEEKSFAHQNN